MIKLRKEVRRRLRGGEEEEVRRRKGGGYDKVKRRQKGEKEEDKSHSIRIGFYQLRI